MKKLLKLILGIMMICISLNNVNAAENIVKSEIKSYDKIYTISNGVKMLGQTRGNSKPSRSTKWNLKSKGKYEMSGASSYTVIYSGYNFTGTDKMNIMIVPTKVGNVTFELYKNNIFADTLVGTYTAELGKSTMFILSNLESKGLYYLKFSVPCYFNGYIVDGN